MNITLMFLDTKEHVYIDSAHLPEKLTRDYFLEIFEDEKAIERAFSVQLGEGFRALGDYVFMNLAHLKSITLPESLEEIGSGAFQGCYSLERINIPKNLSILNEKIFLGCFSLNEVITQTPQKTYLPSQQKIFDYLSICFCFQAAWRLSNKTNKYGQKQTCLHFSLEQALIQKEKILQKSSQSKIPQNNSIYYLLNKCVQDLINSKHSLELSDRDDELLQILIKLDHGKLTKKILRAQSFLTLNKGSLLTFTNKLKTMPTELLNGAERHLHQHLKIVTLFNDQRCALHKKLNSDLCRKIFNYLSYEDLGTLLTLNKNFSSKHF